MREIPLTQGYVALVDDDDYEVAARFNWHAQIKRRKDGTVKNVYAGRNVRVGHGWKMEKLHRFVLGLTDKSIQVDHRDHNGLNCQKTNLRTCTQFQNNGNRRLGRDNTSGIKGVSWRRDINKWAAQIDVNGQRKHLGFFADKAIAATTYAEAANKAFGEFVWRG